ncbi:uncharacterized protein LOC144618900 [Crassostrea virginica]
MDRCRRLRLIFVGLCLFSIFLSDECRKLEGYSFPVYTTDFCPRNETEWKARSSTFNCSKDSSYACFPNENITELLEFCYPLRIIAIQEGNCLFLARKRSELNSIDCKGFTHGCPTSHYLGSTVYKYQSCVSIGNGCFLAEQSCESTTQHTEPKGQQGSHWIETILIPSLIGALVLCSIVFLSIVIYRRTRSNNRQLTNDEENPERHKLLSHNDRDEPDYEKWIVGQWQEDDNFFVSTKAAQEVDSVVKTNNLIIVLGHSGSGKSAIIQHIALKYRKQGWVVKPMFSAEEIHHAFKAGHYMKDKTIFVFNDPIGKESLDEILLNEWERYKDTINLLIKPIKLLLSCRKSVFLDQRADEFFKEKRKIIDIDESDIKLNKEEKILMLEKHLSTDKPTQEEIGKILETEMYFPLLCKMYSNYSKEGNRKVIFFKEPVTVLSKEIKSYKNKNRESYCALVCLVLFNGKICLKDLIENSTLFSKSLQLCKLPPHTLPSTIFNELKKIEGCFVKKIGNTYSFYHDFVMEVTTFILGTEHPVETIQYADISFLRKRVILEINTSNDAFTISLSDDYIDELVNRLFQELLGDRFLEVVLNPCLKEEKVVNGIIKRLEKDNDTLEMMIKRKQTGHKQQNSKLENEQMKKKWYTRLDFVSSESALSLLFALIAFQHDQISRFCLQKLQQNKKNLKNSDLFAAACCNGSEMLIQIFTKEQTSEFKEEAWDNMLPVHIISVFHNHNLLDNIIKNSNDANELTTDEIHWTPLILASANDMEDEGKCNLSCTTAVRRDETIKRLIQKGADVNLCNVRGLSPLYMASQNGHESTAKLLLDNGADVNLCTYDGRSPLWTACFEGHNSTAQLLLNKGADVNLPDNDGDGPLHVACQEGHESTAQLLLKNAAGVNSINKDGISPFYRACRNGHESTAKLLLDNGADVNLCNNDGRSPLWTACFEGHDSTAQLLLNKGADVNLSDNDGDGPLHVACQEGHESTAQLLLKNAAGVNLINKDGISPLYRACRNGHESTAKLLLDNGADVNLCDNEGSSPLWTACFEGHDSTAQLLLNKGADVNLSDNDGDGPLHVACQEGHESTAQLLLKNAAGVNSINKDGISPLYRACRNGHESTAKLLLDNGADVNLCDNEGSSPLWTACFEGHDSTAQLLLNKGADVNLSDNDGDGPLYMACQEGHESTAELLLNKGADVNLRKGDGVGPLYIACQEGHERTVQLLLNSSADISLCMNDGSSPLYVACCRGHANIVQVLLENGSDVNLPEHGGGSPLYIACYRGHEKTANILLNKGANVNQCKSNGATPLYAACQNGRGSIVQLLLRHGADASICMNDGAGPIFVACQNGHKTAVETLIETDAGVNLCMGDGTSPLYIASQRGHETIAQLLLDRGALVNLCNKYNSSPLYAACFWGYCSIAQLLLRNGANINQCLDDGSTPLHASCFRGHESIVQYLLKNGADLDLCDIDGSGPLYRASQIGHENTVRILLDNNANVNSCTKIGASPLYGACENGHVDVVQLLIKSGADVNLAVMDDNSSLLIACQNGHHTTVQVLLNSGADVNLCNKKGCSPFYAACFKGYDKL